MRILVIGGAGYIGSHTVYRLIEKKHEVVIIDNLQTGFTSLLHPLATFYKGDIRDRDFMNAVFDKESIDGVIHFGANSLVGESMKDPLTYFDNNVYGTLVLLQTMQAHHIKDIVFSSTAATYGEVQHVPIREEDTTLPTNPYGETKLTMEKMMKWCDQAYGMKYVALRYFNACGAHPNTLIGELHNPETHLIPLILQVALKQRASIDVYGNDYPTKDGTCIRDYIHVVDLADAHIKAMEYLKQGKKSITLNLGNGKGFSVLEIIEAVKAVSKQNIKVNFVPRRSGDPASLIASNALAKVTLNWDIRYTDIHEIIETAWNFYKERIPTNESENTTA